MQRLLPAALLAFAATPAAALSCNPPEPRFRAHEDNFAQVKWTRDNGWVDRFERSLHANFSVKYTLCGEPYTPRRSREAVDPAGTKRQNGGGNAEIFVAYTGAFDFYVGERSSDPVINRLNNPGLFWRLPVNRFGDGKGDENITLSIEHRSNGQAAEVDSDADALRARRLYDERVRPFFDTVSRGSNFVGVNYEAVHDRLEFGAKLLLYFTQDSAVRWGPLADQGRRFSDYERVRLRAGYQFGDDRWLDAELRLGDKGPRTASFVLGLEWPVGVFPVYVRYQNGPMGTLSNYTQRQESIGIGVRFARH